jgi:hypothetical protein
LSPIFFKCRKSPLEERELLASAMTLESINETKRVGGQLAAGPCSFVPAIRTTDTPCRRHATAMPKIDFSIQEPWISRINHDEKKIFSRLVLASSENFAFVNGGNFAQRLIEGETR